MIKMSTLFKINLHIKPYVLHYWVYSENTVGTQVILSCMKLRYDIFVTTRTRTDNIAMSARHCTPLDHGDGCSIIEGEFLFKGNYLPSTGLELG